MAKKKTKFQPLELPAIDDRDNDSSSSDESTESAPTSPKTAGPPTGIASPSTSSSFSFSTPMVDQGSSAKSVADPKPLRFANVLMNFAPTMTISIAGLVKTMLLHLKPMKFMKD